MLVIDKTDPQRVCCEEIDGIIALDEQIDRWISAKKLFLLRMVMVLLCLEMLKEIGGMKKRIRKTPKTEWADPDGLIFRQTIDLQRKIRRQHEKMPESLKLARWLMHRVHHELWLTRAMASLHDEAAKPQRDTDPADVIPIDELIGHWDEIMKKDGVWHAKLTHIA